MNRAGWRWLRSRQQRGDPLLRRVCIVNSAGHVLLDSFVRPRERVTDLRTNVSGVRWGDLRDAPPFDAVQRQVAELLRGRILVGHALSNDLEVRFTGAVPLSHGARRESSPDSMQVLQLMHPRRDVRDTAKYPPLMRNQVLRCTGECGRVESLPRTHARSPPATACSVQAGRLKPRALRHLALELGLVIQEGCHSPVSLACLPPIFATLPHVIFSPHRWTMRARRCTFT